MHHGLHQTGLHQPGAWLGEQKTSSMCKGLREQGPCACASQRQQADLISRALAPRVLSLLFGLLPLHVIQPDGQPHALVHLHVVNNFRELQKVSCILQPLARV